LSFSLMFSSTSSLVVPFLLAVVAASPAQQPFGTDLGVSENEEIPLGWIDPRIGGGRLLDVC
jgi:hypothetical protein